MMIDIHMHKTMHFLSQTIRYNLSFIIGIDEKRVKKWYSHQCGQRRIKKSDNKKQRGKKVNKKGNGKSGDIQSGSDSVCRKGTA